MGRRGKLSAALAAVAVLGSMLALTARAEAHAIGLSSGEYTASDRSLKVKLSFARGEVAGLAPAIDADRDGHVSAVEVSQGRALLEAKVLSRIAVQADGAACKGTLTDAALTEQDGLQVEGRYECASANGGIEVDAAILNDLPFGHRHIARTVSGEATHDEVLYRDHRTVKVPAGGATQGAEAKPAAKLDHETPGGAFSFFKMGIEHILTGYDHLVFLLGLVLARGRVRQLIGVVTAFTIAHSISLALAAFGVWAPSPRIIEPAIALSIVYVGIENFFVKDASKRWRITFPFGLIHGFGFAGALQEINLPRGQIPGALFSFNLGVEAGQLAVMAIVLPIIFSLRKQDWFEPRAVRVVSGAVAVAGGVWFVLRVVSGG
jgi:hydrogenase/urease accessory protein HupE